MLSSKILQALTEYRQVLGEYKKEVLSLTDKIRTQGDLPDYDSIKSRKVLYEGYANAVQMNDKVTTSMMNIASNKMSINSVKRAIRSMSLTPSERNLILESVKQTTDIITEIEEILKPMLIQVEARLRFFSACQYLLGSPRLSDIE